MELTEKDIKELKISLKLNPADKAPAKPVATSAVTPAKAKAPAVVPVIQPEDKTVVTKEPENNFWKVLGILGLILLGVLALFGIYHLLGGGAASAGTEQGLIHPLVVEKDDLAHLAYWTSATEKDRWPDMKQFNIIACHNDPDANGNANVVFLIGDDIKTSDLKLTYYNGYSGEWNDAVKNQIITEIQDSVRPHVPGFTLNKIDITHIN